MAMLCSDDKHPDELLAGHINALVRRAVERGIDVFDALQAACVNPVEHYGLDVGLLRVGDPADFIEVDSLDGRSTCGARGSTASSSPRTATTLIPRVEPPVVNQFVATHVQPERVRRAAPSRDASCR